MKYTIVQESRLGARRMNQDRVGYWRTPESLLMVVCDGMGGHLNGEVAANLAADLFGAAFQREARPSSSRSRSRWHMRGSSPRRRSAACPRRRAP
jgi:serine/threonine protein phosphatase PrpC